MHLRQRAIFFGTLWLIVAIAIGVFSLFSLVDSLTLERLDRDLIERHARVTAALNTAKRENVSMEMYFSDPLFQGAQLENFWVAKTDSEEAVSSANFASRSLDISVGTTSELQFNIVEIDSTKHRLAVNSVVLEDELTWQIAVGSAIEPLLRNRTRILLGLLVLCGMIVFTAVLGAVLQVWFVFNPLKRLRGDVAQRWETGRPLDPAQYPKEVIPLIVDLNAVLERNHDIFTRGRRQAADLAHALKTQSAILRNSLYQLVSNGSEVGEAVEALDRLDAQLDRSLARMRASNTNTPINSLTDVTHSLMRLERLFINLAQKAGKTISFKIEAGMKARIDVQDLEEIVGNLVDNALKFGRKAITLDATSSERQIVVRVCDDGDGIQDHEKRKALKSGQRLDSSVPGTGLGLAIATDLLAAYGGSISLDTDPVLGGLDVSVKIPSVT